VTYLTTYQLLPLKRAAELVSDILGIKISQGMIVASGQEAYEKLEEPESVIKDDIVSSEVVCFDESGIRVNGETYWLHSAGTKTSTAYSIHKKRGLEAMEAMNILPRFFGTAIHDHWKSYYHYLCAHGECNAHHIRLLRYLYEDLGQEWAGKMTVLLLRIKRHVDLSKSFGADRLDQEDIGAYEAMYRAILKKGAEKCAPADMPTEGRRMFNRLTNFEQETLLFMIDFEVPFTNNLAERDIRMPKAKQKISGGFRSDSGANAFARIRGFISTVKKRGKNVLDGLTAVFNGQALEFLEKTTVQT
jgi:transposase